MQTLGRISKSHTGVKSLKLSLICSTAFLLMSPQFVFAQEVDAVGATVKLDEIIVTAQKRSENLQDVPISVSAVSGAKIRDAKIERLDELSTFVPNLQINQVVISDRISIRGIGSGEQAGFEQSVGTFVDGIYRGRSVQSRFAFMDIANVEVLRGPQGTLFGKNTVAGALNITTAKPTDSFEGYAGVSYDIDKESLTFNGAVSGPLSENIRGRLAFQTRNQNKGWIENGINGDDYPTLDEYGVRASLEWDVSPNTMFSLKYEHGDFDSNGLPYEHVVAGPYAALGVEGDPDYLINIDSIDLLTGQLDPVLDFGSFQTFKGDSDEFSGTIVHDFAGGGDLTVIGAYSQYDFVRDLDADIAPIALLRFDDDESFDQTSLEIRYASDPSKRLSYLFGGFYLNSDLLASGLTYANINTFFALTAGGCAAGDPTTDAGTAFACGTNAALTPLIGSLTGVQRNAVLHQEAETFALFGQGTWDLSDTLSVTGGLRYTNETKDGEQSVVAGNYVADDLTASSNPLAVAVSEQLLEFTSHDFSGLSRKEESVTWSLNGQWDVTENNMLYASASTGFKAGGFNSFYMGKAAGQGAFADDVDFDEEDAIAFELGSKSRLLDGAAELNIALFHTKYDNLQAAVFSGDTSFTVENAAKARTQGIEFDGRWRVSENLTLTGGGAWTDFEFQSFRNQGCTNDQFIAYRQALFTGPLGPAAAGLTAADCAAAGVNDLAGKTSTDTPEFSFNLGVNYVREIGNYVSELAFDYGYTSSAFRQGDLDPILKSDSINLLNARLGIGPQNDAWRVDLLIKNLANEYEITAGNDVPLSYGSHFGVVMPPRTFIIGVSANF